MRTKLFLMTLVALFTTLSTQLSAATAPSKEETVVMIADLHCQSCVDKIEKNIPYEKGVKNLKVDLKSNRIAIAFRSDKNSVENLKKAIEKLGVKVLSVQGKQTAACPSNCDDCTVPKCPDTQCKDKKCKDVKCKDTTKCPDKKCKDTNCKK